MSATTCACLLFPLVLVATVWSAIDDRCNEAVCASVVSKCQLLQRCSCDRSNSSCTLDCFKCLDYLYMECCSCVSICPKANETDPLISTESHAEHLSEPLPSLFTTLTEEEDQLLRWTTFSFPVQVSFVTTSGNDPKENTFGSDTKVTLKDDGFDEEEDVQTNCTVAFMADCMPFNKCKSSCSSMGASSYRWFHDGCCQCVGPKCVDFGVNESKCRMCPLRQVGDNGPMAVDNSASDKGTGEGSDYEVEPAPGPERDVREEEKEGQGNGVKASREDREKSEQGTPVQTTTKKTTG